MDKKIKLVFATNNAHKLKEAREILSDKFEVMSLSEINCHDEIPETAETLEGNALIKAMWVKEKYGYDCFADDTGLMVDALDGAPGVYSARYAGEECTPDDNIEKLLKEMQGKKCRNAHFSTVIALLQGNKKYTFEGTVCGTISTHRQGVSGFGYDPIFIESESGVSFAEMSAEKKNSISHRGRALKKMKEFLGVIIFVILASLSCFGIKADTWRMHPSHDGQIERMIETPDYIYILSTKQAYVQGNAVLGRLFGSLFRYDKKHDEMIYLNKVNLLSGNTVVAIEYNFDKKYLVIGYEDGNIDLLYDNDNVINVPGLKIGDPSLDKTINSFSFDKAANLIYVATGFGYLSIDDKSGEIKVSRIFNKNIGAVAKFDGKLFVGDESGIYCGSENAFSLAEFEKIDVVPNVAKLIPTTYGYLHIYSRKGNTKWSYLLSKSDGGYSVMKWNALTANGIEPSDKGVFMIGGQKVWWWDDKGKISTFYIPVTEQKGNSMGSYDGKNIWVNERKKGIFNTILPQTNNGDWKINGNVIPFNASNAFMCTSMAYHPQYGVLVRNHGWDPNFNPSANNYYALDDLISGYKNMDWTPLSATYRVDMQGLIFDNPEGISIDPNNSDHVYCGSMRSGMLRLDLKDPSKSMHMSIPGDINKGYGNPGFVAVVPDPPAGAWKERCLFAAPEFDSYGNLWTAYGPEVAGGGIPNSELWVWTPAKRAASVDEKSFQNWKTIKLNGVDMSIPKILPLKYHKNLVVYISNGSVSSIVVYNHNGTPEDLSDDSKVVMRNIYDQDGNQVKYFGVRYIYEDPATGMVWVGHSNGVFTFSPAEVFSNSESVRRIKVARNDGTNLADYLLDGIAVNYITIDGSGRKWFATNGGGIVCTSADGRTILKSYTSENSELPGNSVYAMCWNPQTKSMMISTDQGLCEYFPGSMDSSGDMVEARVYPNPVRPEFYGYVTIDGLPDDAYVKIVDSAGNLIKECGAESGGEVKWDVTNIYHKRVPGGVYFVMCSNGPAGDSYSRISKIMVVE